MLHAFTSEPGGGAGLAEEPPTTSGCALPPHGLDIAKVTATYTALLQVPSCTLLLLCFLCICSCLVLNLGTLNILSHSHHCTQAQA